MPTIYKETHGEPKEDKLASLKRNQKKGLLLVDSSRWFTSKFLEVSEEPRNWL